MKKSVLRAELAECARVFEQGEDFRKSAMVRALAAALDAMESLGATEDELSPLIALLVGLDRLNRGRRVPALEPRKGTPPDPVDGAHTVLQAQSLVVVEIIYRAMGGTRGGRRKAEDQAAKILAEAGFKTALGRPVTKDILRQWRSLLTGDTEESQPLREAFDHYMAYVPVLVPAEMGLKRAAEFARAAITHPAHALS